VAADNNDEERHMSKLWKQGLAVALVLGLGALASPLRAAEKSEDELIAQLGSPNPDKVGEALQHLEKQYPTSTKAFPTIKKLLSDPREKVRRKAARVLGALHAEVDSSNLKDICALLKSPDNNEVIDGLKALRGLKAAESVPDIVPLLKHPHINVIRDACRTLSVLGNKDTVPALEPLLSHPDPKVKKDAQDAIYILKAKS
jgi:HEAT repeat protein